MWRSSPIDISSADRDKRYLRRTFSYYLAPAVVDRLVAGNKPPALGGETRNLTVLFSDLEKFTSLSEKFTPEELVTFLNSYLSAMTDIIEAFEGFVDKYIGDAIVAVFGAPVDDPEHAQHAVYAALACRARIAELQRELQIPDGAVLNARIGINSGPILVGNIGSRKRFNYTVMGDAVNLAARLEAANKAYNSRILVSDSTVARCGTDITFREVDRVGVVGRDEPLTIFEPIDRLDSITPGQRNVVSRYAQALSAYRASQFAEAAEMFQALTSETQDPVSGAMLERALHYAAAPPPADWGGITRLESK